MAGLAALLCGVLCTRPRLADLGCACQRRICRSSWPVDVATFSLCPITTLPIGTARCKTVVGRGLDSRAV